MSKVIIASFAVLAVLGVAAYIGQGPEVIEGFMDCVANRYC